MFFDLQKGVEEDVETGNMDMVYLVLSWRIDQIAAWQFRLALLLCAADSDAVDY